MRLLAAGRWIFILLLACVNPAKSSSNFPHFDGGYYPSTNAAWRALDQASTRRFVAGLQLEAANPTNVGRHSTGMGHHSPGVGHHPPGVGHHPPGVGHHPPGVGHHPPGVGHHRPKAPPLVRAYTALQAWKRVISKDPLNITGSWVGRDVCQYQGVFCGPSLEDPSITVVSGIDLNHAHLGGVLPEELGQLEELGIIHLNSNEFLGTLPESLRNLALLAELDVSNNKLSGTFPTVTLHLPSLIYLDIRFNGFYGRIPSEIFTKRLDALFLNDNEFDSSIPDSFGGSPVSVVVLANNRLAGHIPRSIGNMSRTLNEILFLNNRLTGAIPAEVGLLNQVEVFDASSNKLSNELPNTISNMVNLMEFNLANNRLSGNISGGVCSLPKIRNLTLTNNFFIGEGPSCEPLARKGVLHVTGNCLSNRGGQRSGNECRSFYAPRPAPVPRRPPAPKPSPPRAPALPSPPLTPKPPQTSPPRAPAPPPASKPPPNPPSPVPIAPAPTPSTCPSGFTAGLKSGRCFMLVEQFMTWGDGQSYCKQRGGQLASVASLEELKDLGELCHRTPSNKSLVDPFSPRGQGCYLDGTKTGQPFWYWSEAPCVQFNSSYWNFLEPNNLNGNENCTTIKYEPPILRDSRSSPAYMLNDLYCGFKLPFICSLRRC